MTISHVTPRGHGTGWVYPTDDDRDYVLSLEAPALEAASRAQTGGILSGQLPAIWDQSQIGSCTAHGSLRAYIAAALKQGESIPMLSRLFQYFNSRDDKTQDTGAQVRDAMRALATLGCCPEEMWPYDISRFADTPPAPAYIAAKRYVEIEYKRVPVGVPFAMRGALLSGRVIVFGFRVPSYFEDGSWDPASGEPLPLPDDKTEYIGRHCVAATYFNFSQQLCSGPYWTGRRGSFFTCDNSWGNWGMAGRFNMDSEWFNPARQLAADYWVVDAVS